MDPGKLKREFGSRIACWGRIDTQKTCPWPLPENVRAEVRQRIDELGANGGYVLAPTQGIQEDASPANLIAMIDEAHQYRASNRIRA